MTIMKNARHPPDCLALGTVGLQAFPPPTTRRLGPCKTVIQRTHVTTGSKEHTTCRAEAAHAPVTSRGGVGFARTVRSRLCPGPASTCHSIHKRRSKERRRGERTRARDRPRAKPGDCHRQRLQTATAPGPM